MERDFVTGFGRRASWDEFEVERRGTAERYAMQPFQPTPSTLRESCFGCHAVSNLYGTRGFQRQYTFDEEFFSEQTPPMYPVAEMHVQVVEQAAVKWKQSQPGWLTLQKLLN
jgi:hypothetical protein